MLVPRTWILGPFRAMRQTTQGTPSEGEVAEIAHVGTLEWAHQTGGQLTRWQDQLTLFRQSVPAWIEVLADRLMSPLRSAKRSDLPPIPTIPHTRIAQEAEQLCPPWLRDHCYRTYVIGALLGRDLCFDQELLFVASMLHDVGLSPDLGEFSDRAPDSDYVKTDAPCFAVRGAGVAERLATNQGWPRARGRALAEAISLHLNVRVARSQGVEAHLLNAGTAFDVIRLRSRKLSQELIDCIERKWPRGDDFCANILAAWKCESEDHPDCRVAFLGRRPLSFERRIRKACPTE
jgi:hypothetical protein